MDQTVSMSREEVQARCAALGWSQNELARRIKKNPGYVSGVLSGRFVSSVVWKRIHRKLAQAERRAGLVREPEAVHA